MLLFRTEVKTVMTEEMQVEPGWYWCMKDGSLVPLYHAGGGLWYYDGRRARFPFKRLGRIPYLYEG